MRVPWGSSRASMLFSLSMKASIREAAGESNDKKKKVNCRAIDNECIMKVYMKLGSEHPYACMDKWP